MKYIVEPTSQFKKDYKLAQKQHCKLELLHKIVEKLANGELLPPENKDHALSGNWNNHRDSQVAQAAV